jgi:hypothetical protein
MYLCEFPYMKNYIKVLNYVYLTSLMEHSPSSEASGSAPVQEIPKNLWNCRNHKSPPLVYILNQINKANSTTSHCSKIHVNFIN